MAQERLLQVSLRQRCQANHREGALENTVRSLFALVRQEFEDKMEESLAKSNVTGIKSHMIFPPRNELMEGELRQRIREGTLDAVLVARPKEARQESEEVVTGGFYVLPPGYYAF